MNGANALRERARIPTRRHPFAVLALFKHARAFRHDAAAIDAVAQNGLKCPFNKRIALFRQRVFDVFRGKFKPFDAFREPLRVALRDHRLPDRRDLLIFFHKRHVRGEAFKGRRQADNAAARKRLNQFVRASGQACQPCANARHEPRLPARIPERAALRHGRDIDDALPRGMFKEK